MKDKIKFFEKPKLKSPTIIAGFEGWPNAGEVSTGTLKYLIKSLNPKPLASMKIDDFFSYHSKRPTVKVERGKIIEIVKAKNNFFYWINQNGNRDVILFMGTEPHLKWEYFIDIFLKVCEEMKVKQIITIGGTTDNITHEEEMISALATDEKDIKFLDEIGISPIDYYGPTSIHSMIITTSKEKGFSSISLWGHVPFYIKGSNFRVYRKMIDILQKLTGFYINTTDLEMAWQRVKKQIDLLIEKNPELKQYIEAIKKGGKGEKPTKENELKGEVIRIDEFLKSKEEPEKDD
ncbi:MAG: hypothetical protein DRP55_03315 [Spirochaetes bacterium]|nr:PAC2 family protein [Deltaproteobacteria bacterium]RKY02131.1 MAG: hypothetical protein DRP55_03315 [Spirochaetota bacterium]RLA91807.1 MAG: hypothetical protein DRG20_00280 [Deltaproteobacteria bacterium]